MKRKFSVKKFKGFRIQFVTLFVSYLERQHNLSLLEMCVSNAYVTYVCMYITGKPLSKEHLFMRTIPKEL